MSGSDDGADPRSAMGGAHLLCGPSLDDAHVVPEAIAAARGLLVERAYIAESAAR